MEAFSALKVALIAVLLCAVIALKFISQKADGALHDEALVESLASDLQIDTALDKVLDSKGGAR